VVEEIKKGLTQKEINEKAVEMELLRQDMQKIDQQLVALETRKMQMHEVLEAIKTMKGGEDILIPLGPGFFVKGELKKGDKVLLGVGANIVLEKNIGEAERDIKKSIRELEKLERDMKSDLVKMSERMDDLQKMLIKYYGG